MLNTCRSVLIRTQGCSMSVALLGWCHCCHPAWQQCASSWRPSGLSSPCAQWLGDRTHQFQVDSHPPKYPLSCSKGFTCPLGFSLLFKCLYLKSHKFTFHHVGRLLCFPLPEGSVEAIVYQRMPAGLVSAFHMLQPSRVIAFTLQIPLISIIGNG